MRYNFLDTSLSLAFSVNLSNDNIINGYCELKSRVHTYANSCERKFCASYTCRPTF